MYDYWRSLVNEINKTHKQHIHSRSICINKRIVAVRNWLVHWHALLLKKKKTTCKKTIFSASHAGQNSINIFRKKENLQGTKTLRQSTFKKSASHTIDKKHFLVLAMRVNLQRSTVHLKPTTSANENQKGEQTSRYPKSTSHCYSRLL